MPGPCPTRRQLLIGTAALAALATSLPRAARAGGKRVLLIGDSMIATALGQRIEHGLERHGFSVHRRGKSSSGLARPDFFDWHAEATKLVDKHQPDGVVLMMGGNDTQGLRTDTGWIKWGAAGWNDAYAERVERLLDIVTPAGQPVCWVGLPIVRSPGYRKKVSAVNALVEKAVAARDGATFVSTWQTLTVGGDYTATMKVGGKDEAVRGSDGIHLTVAGARVLELAIREQVVASLGVRVG